EANYLCKILAQDPKLPGIYGIHAEFVCDPWRSWNEWKKELKDRFDISQKGNPTMKDPILAILQICHADGTVVMFNFYLMGLLPMV
uniref:Uncharacterized protein n=1 Tax=Romanomermis culicivorax TaxID=13658 RepID=A0A915JRY4_ROMCU